MKTKPIDGMHTPIYINMKFVILKYLKNLRVLKKKFFFVSLYSSIIEISNATETCHTLK